AGKVEPLAGVAATLVTPQASEANVAVLNVTTTLHPPTVFVMMSAGQAIVGGCRSRTITRNVQLFVLPDASVAATVTMFVPSANPLPLGGVALTLVSEQLSVAKEAVENATTVEQPTVVLVVTSAGQSIVGGS